MSVQMICVLCECEAMLMRFACLFLAAAATTTTTAKNVRCDDGPGIFFPYIVHQRPARQLNEWEISVSVHDCGLVNILVECFYLMSKYPQCPYTAEELLLYWYGAYRLEVWEGEKRAIEVEKMTVNIRESERAREPGTEKVTPVFNRSHPRWIMPKNRAGDSQQFVLLLLF